MSVSVNKQVRGFVVIWTLITVIMGTATFFGIYLTYNVPDDVLTGGNQVGIPAAPTDVPEQVAVVVTNSPEPATLEPSDTPTEEVIPTDEPTEVAMVEEPAEDEMVEEVTDEEVTEQPVMEQQAVEEPEPTATPLPISDESFQLAIQVQASIDNNPEIQQMWMNDVGALGLNWFKQQIRWDEIELAPGEFDWARLDVAMEVNRDYGYNVLATVVTAPDWAREPGADLSEVGPPADVQDYVNFLEALLERYPGQLHAIEVWNEQNIDREWTSPEGLSAANYVDLLRESYIAIKDIDPGIIVISGALAPTGGFVDPQTGIVGAIDDFDFMDQLIDVGMLNYADCVGAHHNGYNISPSVTWDNVPNDPDATFRGPFDNPHHSWSFRSTLQTYANKIRLAGGDQRLCVTEFGWPVTEDLGGTPVNFGFADDNTLEEQAEWLIEAIDNMIEWDIVWIASIWNLNYGPQAGWDPASDNTPYSLIGPDWVRRPAFEAVVQWTAQQREQSGP